jgi:hypothetical protein
MRYNYLAEDSYHDERIEFMRKIYKVLVIIPCLFILIISCSGPQKSAEEESALNSLTRIQNGLESNITYDNFVGMLNEAKMEVDQLKQSPENNRCFVSAVEKCYASYEIARKAWKQKLETEDDKRRQDMEMTYSFSLSFATLNIEKANNCYK